jgi:hypothetical protein
MRFVVLIFGLLGAAGSVYLGTKWISDREKLAVDVEKLPPERKAELDKLVKSAYAMIGGAILGLAGVLMALNRMGIMAAGLFIVGVAVPVVLSQEPKILVFTFGLAIAGLLSFLIRKKTPAPQGGH